VVVAPGLTVGATDARRFVDIAEDVYRFMPLQLTEPERAAIHGTDERVKLDNLALFPAFYRQVIRRGAGD
jgi:carboxypeptidase PM20D1